MNRRLVGGVAVACLLVVGVGVLVSTSGDDKVTQATASPTTDTVATTPDEPDSSPASLLPKTTTTTTVAPTTTSTAPPVSYVFPVQPPATASYGRSHHDYPATDIFAPCGTSVVAVTDGTISEVSSTDEWNATTNDGAVRGGLSIALVGTDGVRYYGSHLSAIAPAVVAGAKVEAGELLGAVGDSGNAAGTGCHLHFGISPPCGIGDWEIRRGVVAPPPYLDAWRGGDVTSPSTEVVSWRADHPADCP